MARVGTKEAFMSDLRSGVRAVWMGEWSVADFQGHMLLAIDNAYRRAWIAGAREYGITSESELTDAELDKLNNMIFDAYGHVADFGVWVEEHSRANGGRLTDAFARLPLWADRYDQVVIQGRVMAARDGKLVWVLGHTEQHCSSCLKLTGQVRRASFWNDRGILPRVPGAPYLECGGWRCDCDLIPTDAPISRGRLPSLP